MSTCARCNDHSSIAPKSVCFFCAIAMDDERRLLGGHIGRDLWPIEGVSHFQSGAA